MTQISLSSAVRSLRSIPRASCFAAAWLVLLLILHCSIVLSIVRHDQAIIWPLHNDTIHRAGRAADFFAIYHAGVNVRFGGNPFMCDPDGITPYFSPFRYLPIVAQAATVLTYLPPFRAYLLWILILEVSLAVLLVALYRKQADKKVWLISASILLMSSPYFLELYVGQFTFITFVLFAFTFLLAGGPIYFTLSVLLKPVCLAVLPSFVHERRYWFHGISTIVILFLVSTPYFLRHPDAWQIFLRHNLQATGALDAGNHGLIRLVFLLVRDYHPGSITEEWQWVRLVSHIRLSVLAATTLIVLLRGKKHRIIGASSLLLAHFLTYQHVWEHHMSAVLVIGALMLTVNEIPKWFTVTVLASMVCLALPTPFVFLDTLKDPSVFDPSFDWPLYASYLEVLPKVLPTMALYFACVGMLWKHGSWPTVNILRRVALINH